MTALHVIRTSIYCIGPFVVDDSISHCQIQSDNGQCNVALCNRKIMMHPGFELCFSSCSPSLFFHLIFHRALRFKNIVFWWTIITLHWHHNERDGISSHRRLLFAQPYVRSQIKENIKVPHHWPMWWESTDERHSPHKGPITRKMFSFDDVILIQRLQWSTWHFNVF